LTRWQAFTAICGALRAGLLGDTRAPDFGNASWETIIEVGSKYWVTPALGWCLKNEPGLPADVKDYFDAALALNAERNATMLGALAKIVRILNGIGITPVLLKGAARLIDGVYPVPGLRFLGDLDILVPAPQARHAAASLRDAGWSGDPPERHPLPHHHLPMLHDEETGVGVELHTGIVYFSAMMSTDWFLAGAHPHAFENGKVLLADPTRQIAHIVVHDQIDHMNYWRRNLDLRQLLDLTLIRAKCEHAIDWTAIEAHFAAITHGKLLANYLKLAETLLGQKMPQLRHAPRLLPTTQIRWTVDPPPWQPLDRAAQSAIDFIGHRWRDPRGVQALVDPALWPGRLKRFAAALKRRP